MEKFILVHGMQRSGNHAVIQWLESHDRFIFINNAIAIAPILAGEAEMPATENFRSWIRKQQRNPLLRFAPWTLLQMSLARYELMASLEDHELTVRPFFDGPRDETNALIVRNPYNMFASRIRRASQIDHPTYPRETGTSMDRVVRNWKSHAREFLGETNTLTNLVGIYFDAWFASEAYRRETASLLGYAFDDSGFAQVSNVGGGSSFSGSEFNGKNAKMNVLGRANDLEGKEAELLGAVFEDDELVALARAVDEVGQARGASG